MGWGFGERPSWVVHLWPAWHHGGPLGLEDSVPQCFLTHIPGTIILTDLSLSHSFLPPLHTHATWHLILEPKHGKQEAELLSVGNYSQKWHSITSTGFILLVQAVKAQPGSRGWEMSISWWRNGKSTLQKSKWGGSYWKIESVTCGSGCSSGQKW